MTLLRLYLTQSSTARLAHNLKLDDYVDDGVPVLQRKEHHGRPIAGGSTFASSRTEKRTELERSSVRVGDILIVKIGSIGYSAILDDLAGIRVAIIPANLAKVTADTDVVDRSYLHRWLTSTDAKRYFVRVASQDCTASAKSRKDSESSGSPPTPPRAAADCGDAGPGGRAAGQAPRRPRPTRHPHPIHLPRHVRRPRHESKGVASPTVGFA